MRWFGLALLGILIAAAVSVAASRLASQQIGLSSQPIEAGDALAPARVKPQPRQLKPHHAPREHPTTSPAPTTPVTSPSAPEPTTTEPSPPPESHPGGNEGDGAAADD